MISNCPSETRSSYDPSYREVDTGNTVKNGEDVGIGKIAEAEIQAGGKQEDQAVQVEEIRSPSCRLMLRYGSNDGNVVLGVGGIEKGVEPAGPGRDVCAPVVEMSKQI